LTKKDKVVCSAWTKSFAPQRRVTLSNAKAGARGKKLSLRARNEMNVSTLKKVSQKRKKFFSNFKNVVFLLKKKNKEQKKLSLTLFVFWICTNNHNCTFSTN
jgi:hypothetical protein